jgi:hypothetical protein
MASEVLDTIHLDITTTSHNFERYILIMLALVTYDHRIVRTALPVCSAVLNHYAGRLVVGSVTTSESLLLYVFFFAFSPLV